MNEAASPMWDTATAGRRRSRGVIALAIATTAFAAAAAGCGSTVQTSSQAASSAPAPDRLCGLTRAAVESSTISTVTPVKPGERRGASVDRNVSFTGLKDLAAISPDVVVGSVVGGKEKVVQGLSFTVWSVCVSQVLRSDRVREQSIIEVEAFGLPGDQIEGAADPLKVGGDYLLFLQRGDRPDSQGQFAVAGGSGAWSITGGVASAMDPNQPKLPQGGPIADFVTSVQAALAKQPATTSQSTQASPR